jgi:hypothetical protein
MTPPTTDHDAHAHDSCDDVTLDPHRTTNERDRRADNDDDDDLIVSVLKRRTADPLPIPDGSTDGSNMMHHQWQGEAEGEDDDIIADIIDRKTSINCPVTTTNEDERSTTDKPALLDSSSSTYVVPPVTGERNFRITIPKNTVPGEKFMVFAGGRNVFVRCPENTKPGEVLQITLHPLAVPNTNEERRESRKRTCWWSQLASIRDKFHHQRTA